MSKGLLPAIIFFTALLAVTGGVLWRWQQQPTTSTTITSLAEFTEQLAHTREIITPPPLRQSLTGSAGELTVAGVLAATNRHRAENGLPALTSNATLDQAARNKLTDMFDQQYFEHVSPDGRGPADVVDNVGYQYLRVGENLALGNYANDDALVQAWMDSPGHRANILHEGFTEIGLAVAPGTFEEHRTWLGVQTFAFPLSGCPTPDPQLESQFNSNRADLEQLVAELTGSAQQLEVDRDSLDAAADEINDLANAGNDKVTAGNDKISQGNEILQATGDPNQAQPLWDEGAALQQAGADLLDEAESKQAAYQQQQAAFETSRTDYNSKITRQEELATDVETLVTQLNSQIQSFNACLQK